MATEREIRRTVISQLVNVYTNTPDLGDDAEPQPLFDVDQPGWASSDFLQAYAELASMFLYYAKETESRYGADFLEHLQRQAKANEQDDDPDANLPAACV